jgi:hypothetical protein
MNIVPNIQPGVNFLYVFLLILLGVYVYFVQRNSGLVSATIGEVFSPRPFLKIKNYSTTGIAISLLIVFNFSFFLYEILHYNVISFLPRINLLWCFLIVAVYYFFVRFILLGMSFLFDEKEFGSTILKFIQIYALCFLLFSVPVMLLMQCFSDNIVVKTLEILFVAGFLLWVVCLLRSVITGRTLTMFSVLNIFLYLCTLQILPILILGKLIILYAAN